MRRALVRVIAVAAAALSCAGPDRAVRAPVDVALVRGTAPPFAASEVAPAPDDFFYPDPPLDDFPPKLEWTFLQESWTGSSAWQQHCREYGYPARLREQARRAIDRIIADRGGSGSAVDTVRMPPLVFAFGDYVPGMIEPDEPLVKAIFCSEGVAPRAGRDHLVSVLRSYPRFPDFPPFGEPKLVWRRVHRGGREEYGVGWGAIEPKTVSEVLAARGYVVEARPSPRTTWTKPNEPVRVREQEYSVSWTSTR